MHPKVHNISIFWYD